MCKLLGLIVAFIFVDAHQLDAHIFLCSLSLVVPVRGLAFRQVSNVGILSQRKSIYKMYPSPSAYSPTWDVFPPPYLMS